MAAGHSPRAACKADALLNHCLQLHLPRVISFSCSLDLIWLLYRFFNSNLVLHLPCLLNGLLSSRHGNLKPGAVRAHAVISWGSEFAWSPVPVFLACPRSLKPRQHSQEARHTLLDKLFFSVHRTVSQKLLRPGPGPWPGDLAPSGGSG